MADINIFDHIPIQVFEKYITQYEICALSSVSKSIREKYYYLHKLFKQFFLERANEVIIEYNKDIKERELAYSYYFITYKYGEKKITSKKKYEIKYLYFPDFYDMARPLVKEISAKNGDIFKFATLRIKFEYNSLGRLEYIIDRYYYKNKCMIGFESHKVTERIGKEGMFPLNKYSYLYWNEIYMSERIFSCPPDKLLLYYDKQLLIYVEILTDKFKYRIYCNKGLLFNDIPNQKIINYVMLIQKTEFNGYQIITIKHACKI